MKNVQLADKKNLLGLANLILVLLGMTSTLLCGLLTVTDGLELLFLLPATFTVCSILFFRAFTYWRDNVAFIIIFVTIFVRYLVTPLLMTFTESVLTTVRPTPENYRLAIFVQMFELFATLIIIDKVWTKHKKKTKRLAASNSKKVLNFELTWTGLIFLAALVALVLLRGRLPYLMNRYSTWWHISTDFSAVYFYDYISVEVIKSVVGITLIAFFARRYRNTQKNALKFLFYFLASAVGISMTMFYMYDQRTALVQLVISSMVILLAFFPGNKKLTQTIFVVGGGILVTYVFATGSMNYDVGGTVDDSMIGELCKMAELYVSGPSMVAITQQNYDSVRENMDFMTYMSDFITTTHIFGMFPFLRFINNMVAGIPTTNALFVQSLDGLTYILPNYSLWTYYVSTAFGWIFEIISIFVVIKVICYIDKKKNQNIDACFFYALAYTETLLGQAIFVNNTFLLWHAFTNLPFWLLVFAFVNRVGKKITFK